MKKITIFFKRRDFKISPRKRLIIKLGGIVIFVLLISFASYTLAMSGRIYRGVAMGGEKLGGKTRTEVKNLLEPKALEFKKGKITLKFQDKTFEAELDTFNLDIDIEESVGKAFSFGRGPGVGKALKEEFLGLFKTFKLPPQMNFDEGGLTDWLAGVAKQIDIPLQETTIEVKGGKARVVLPKPGRKIQKEAIQIQILASIKDFSPPHLEIEVEEVQPQITQVEAEPLLEEAKRLTQKPIILKTESSSFTIPAASLGSWLSLVKTDGKISITLKPEKVRNFLDGLAPKVNTEPQNAKLRISGGKISVFQPAVEGRILEKEKALEQIISAFEKGVGEIDLSFKIEKPEITGKTLAEINKYGIRELIGSGTTDFRGSPANRVHNIKNGARFLDGILIKPGEDFSTLKQLGKVGGATGYLPELVIKEDRTVPEFGGGLCQVSTTLFRAILNSGLKITARRNHSYRVSYYERGFGPGLDATIYSPQPDLKFINDTPAWILIQSRVEGNKLSFDFYGTSDGRSISISKPQIFDITSPGEPIYIEDSSLPAGTVKQLERAHPGAKTIVTYTVSRGGKVINEQVFRSSYVPWRARFVRGPEAPAEETPPEGEGESSPEGQPETPPEGEPQPNPEGEPQPAPAEGEVTVQGG